MLDSLTKNGKKAGFIFDKIDFSLDQACDEYFDIFAQTPWGEMRIRLDEAGISIWPIDCDLNKPEDLRPYLEAMVVLCADTEIVF